MDPTDAQRLARLRTLLVDARRRVGDESELGIHLATVAIDGIGELAIGLCLERCPVQPRTKGGLPARLDQLLETLKIEPPGLQAFRELHRVRNLVQHAGVLPSVGQLPRWLTETEALIDALVLATFGVGLSEVSSASGIKDDDLRRELEEAERKLERGEAEGAFDNAWKALEVARRNFRGETGLHSKPNSIRASQLRRIDRNLGDLSSEIEALADQIELSAFTAEPGEWLWFRQRQGERFRGLPIRTADAKRALAFVLSWVLWFESYISRHGVDRWERWQEEQRAPVTGVPGGPHIAKVALGDRPVARGGSTETLRQWIFQLTDVPEAEPPFDWAIFTALDRLNNSPLTSAHLNPDGGLALSCPSDLEPADVRQAAAELIHEAKELLAARATEEDEDSAKEAAALQRFDSGLREVGCEFEELRFHRSDQGYRVEISESLVWIDIGRPASGNTSAFSKGLEQCFDFHFPEFVSAPGCGASYRSHWRDVGVPMTWDPKRVGVWVTEAAQYDRDRLQELEREREEAMAAEELALSEMQRLISGKSKS